MISISLVCLGSLQILSTWGLDIFLLRFKGGTLDNSVKTEKGVVGSGSVIGLCWLDDFWISQTKLKAGVKFQLELNS